jgi:hypothetical protein
MNREGVIVTRVLLLLLAVAGACFAQQTFEIRGTVTEPGLGGIAGAEVRVSPRFTSSAEAEARKGEIITSYTNARGEFTARPTKAGPYSVAALREGYFIYETSSPTATVDADHPVGQVRLVMMRLAEMTGRVVDAETREPLKGVAVRALQQILNLDGSRGWSGAAMLPEGPMPTSPEEASRILQDRLNTDAGGVFRLRGLRPGAYVAAVIEQRPNESSVPYSVEQAKIVDMEYERVYWPGALPPNVAVPQEVPSGGVFNVGEIRLKKVPMYRVHLRIPQGDCPVGESVRVSVLERDIDPRPVGVFDCGSETLLRGFVPGSYTLYAVSDWQGERDNVEAAVWATAPVLIGKESAEVTLEPRRGAVMKGRIIAGEGVTTLPRNIPLAIRPVAVVDGSRPGVEQFVEWNEDGTFRIAAGFGAQTLFVGARVVKDGYISRVFYNGAAARDLTMDVRSGEKQDIEIVFDNKFAALEGVVEAGGAPVNVTLWQKDDASPTYLLMGAGGTFQAKVPPGEYRITAVENGRRPLLEDSRKITLKAGETERIVLQVKR